MVQNVWKVTKHLDASGAEKWLQLVLQTHHFQSANVLPKSWQRLSTLKTCCLQFQALSFSGVTHTHIQSYLPICDKCMELSLVISHFDSFFYKGFFTALDHPGDDSQRERAGAVTRSTSETGGGRDDICPGRVCAGAEWCTDLV